MDKKLLDILACPVCKGELSYDKENNELVCAKDHLAFPIRDDIPVMIESEARVIKNNDTWNVSANNRPVIG